MDIGSYAHRVKPSGRDGEVPGYIRRQWRGSWELCVRRPDAQARPLLDEGLL
jgi:hypothetical protein